MARVGPGFDHRGRGTVRGHKSRGAKKDGEEEESVKFTVSVALLNCTFVTKNNIYLTLLKT